MHQSLIPYRKLMFGFLAMLIPLAGAAATAEHCLESCFVACQSAAKINPDCAAGCALKPVCDTLPAKSRLPNNQGGLIKLEPTGKPFSVLLPAEWKQKEYDLLKVHEQYALYAWLPGTPGLDYVLIGIEYFAGIHKSPERYLFEKLSSTGQSGGPVSTQTSLGAGVQTFEIQTSRSPPLGVEAKSIPVARKYLIYPMQRGFAVLVYDAPVALFAKYRPDFERVLRSFKPALEPSPGTDKPKEISADEYQAYTEFFEFDNTAEKIVFPDYFSDVQQARVVRGHTTDAGKLNPETIGRLKKEIGTIDPFLVEDYQRKNRSDYLIKDKILIHGLAIDSGRNNERYAEKAARQEDLSPRRPAIGFESVVTLSRIGFDQEKKTALFYAANSGGGPSTGYFVLMTRSDGKWRVKKAVMDRFLIH